MRKLNLDLASIDGNAFSLMGAFQRSAIDEGWALDQINEVLKEAKSGDYDHLVHTLLSHCRDDDYI